MPLPLPIFDIFNGEYSDKDAIWLDAVAGRAAAKDRMLRISAQKPGP